MQQHVIVCDYHVTTTPRMRVAYGFIDQALMHVIEKRLLGEVRQPANLQLYWIEIEDRLGKAKDLVSVFRVVRN